MRALCVDGDSVWVGTYQSALLKADSRGVREVAPDGSFGGVITSLVREAEDTLWVGTTSGLHRWRRGEVRSWTERDGLLSSSIRALHRDQDGTLWIGTLGGGLVRFKEGHFVHFTTRDGLIDDVISQILPDDSGHLWLGSNRGLMRVSRGDLEAFEKGSLTLLQPLILGRDEGMTREHAYSGAWPTAFKTAAGHLLFPTIYGVVEVDPARADSIVRPSPQVVIEEILLDQRPQPLQEELVIPPGPHRLEITYTAPVLRGGEWLRFRHRLGGRDSPWSLPSLHRTVAFDRLAPGRHPFAVAVAGGRPEGGQATAGMTLIVRAYFWQTAWFRGGTVLALVGLGVAATWWQQRRRHLRQVAGLEREREQEAKLAHLSRLSLLAQLSGSLAHEMNQPLGIILSNAQAGRRMLDQETPDTKELRAILTDIIDEDVRAGELIKRLRALFNRGRAELLPVSLNDVVRDVLHLLRRELAGRGATVRQELAEDLPQVLGDEVQLQQVLINLILNACDAMADQPASDRVIHIASARAGDRALLSVADQGCGLDAEDVERIFQPFVTTKSHGMGIGLSICRSIIVAHYGSLRVAPKAPRGAVFHIELPVIQSAASATTASRDLPS